MTYLLKNLFVFAIILSTASVFFNHTTAKSNAKWQITEQTWQNQKAQPGSQPNDAVLWAATLTPDPSKIKPIATVGWVSKKQLKQEESKRQFLKNLFIALKVGPLKMTTVSNDFTQPKHWPFSLASALSHGQRVLIIFKGVKLKDFWATLGLNAVASKRSVASHGISFDKQGNPLEKKLKGVKGTLKNVQLGLKGQHFYVNIALGGLGEKAPGKDLIIGPGGSPINSKTGKIQKKVQHGHVYIHKQPAKKKIAALLVGVEESAPGKSNFWGGAHTAASAFRSTVKDRSVTGGVKWAQQSGGPAAYGGMVLYINPSNYKKITAEINRVKGLGFAAQREYFRKILAATP